MNMGLLTGEVGSGKTITKNVFINSLPKDDFEVVSFENSRFPFVDILYDIVKRITYRDVRVGLWDDSALPERGDVYMLSNMLKEKIDKIVYEEKRHLVVVFDEAQLMDDEVLDEVKTLTNISSESENYLTIFLVGQPELREKIRRLKQVDQRIFLRFHLNNLDFRNAVDYMEHRLRLAGPPKQTVFTGPARELVFRSTGGVPREINRLCKLALTYGFGNSLEEISKEDLEVVLEDIREHS